MYANPRTGATLIDHRDLKERPKPHDLKKRPKLQKHNQKKPNKPKKTQSPPGHIMTHELPPPPKKCPIC
jgi:hypothetical protein